jgi:IS5 family transposase
MGRNFLAHITGDAINVILSAVGYNFRRLLAWLGFIFALLLLVINQTKEKEKENQLLLA